MERGSLNGEPGGGLFNAAVLIDLFGEVILHDRKIGELGFARTLYAAGDRLGVVDTPFGKVGLMICADAFTPGQVISRSLAMMGARLVLSPCAWAVPSDFDNTREPYGQLWLDNYGPVVREFGVWIAGCSKVGPITAGAWAGRKWIGNSLVSSPGKLIAARGAYGETADELVMVRVELA